MKKAMLILLVMTGCLQAQVTLNIVNQNTDITDPWVTFIQSLNPVSTWETNGYTETTLNGPALNATAGITSLVNGTSYQLSSIGTTIHLAPDWAGNIFFSNRNLSSILGQSGQSPVQPGPAPFPITPFSQPTFFPTDPNGAVTSENTRYNYIEVGGGSGTTIYPDITYINYYSVPIQLTRASDGATRGAPTSQTALNHLHDKLTTLSGNSSTVVVNDANGVARIISPNNGATAQAAYPTFDNYITSAFGGGAKPINITNSYSGHGSLTGVIANQDYAGVTVTYNGAVLVITGSSSESTVGDYTLTWTGSSTDLTSAIYSAVIGGYGVVYDNGNGIITNGNTGDNNVFSAMTRDLLAGFNYGFINSSTTTGLGTIGDLTSQQWMTLSGSEAFKNAQPTDPFYNTWSAAFADTFTNVYTFPFNDFLAGFGPVIDVNTGDTLTVTLLGYNAVPEPSTCILVGLGITCILFSRRRRQV